MALQLSIAEIDVLFEQLLPLSEATRVARLAAIERDDAMLAKTLRRLLELAVSADTMRLRALGRPAPVPVDDDAAAPAIPGYKIGSELGRGGMGAVYLATREFSGVEQLVAIKVLRRALLDDEEVRRFLTEQRILARLRHPNIATLLDAGMLEGRPWMAIERIDGLPIDQNLQPPAQVIAVLQASMQITDALHAAHAHLIVHRDIKPENVLVDSEGRIKLIDFGIAKLLDPGPDAATTATGTAPLTLRYASPEQLLARPVGVASDIYQVGLLMYRLLTDAWPWDETVQQLPSLRMQPEVEPLPPSARVSDARRKRLLRGDVDSIVMRCLRFDPQQRYASALALKEDIRAHLNGEAVLAAAPDTAYRVRKFVRRHRVWVAAGVAAALALLVGLGAFAWQARVATVQRDRAVKAEAEAKQRAEALEQVAAFQASQLENIKTEQMGARLRADILAMHRVALEGEGLKGTALEQRVTSFERALGGINFTSVALDALDETIFERALATIDSEFEEQPLIKAQLLQTIATTLQKLGLRDRANAPQTEALSLRRRLLGNAHADTLASVSATGKLLWSQGKYAEAEPYDQEVLDTRRRVLGDEHPDTLVAINAMGALRQEQARYAEAEPYFREALAIRRRVLGDAHPDTLLSITNLGSLFFLQGQPDAAEPYYREAMETSRRVLGNEHADTLATISNMGALKRAQGHYAEAETFHREALEARRRVLGEAHPDTLMSLNNIGALYWGQARHADAETYFREVLEKRKQAMGPEHPETLRSLHAVGTVLVAQGRLDEAEPFLREALASRRRLLGERHPYTLASIAILAELLRDQGSVGEAEQLAIENEQLTRAVHGDDGAATQRAVALLETVRARRAGVSANGK
jgi:hypothetical protein